MELMGQVQNLMLQQQPQSSNEQQQNVEVVTDNSQSGVQIPAQAVSQNESTGPARPQMEEESNEGQKDDMPEEVASPSVPPPLTSAGWMKLALEGETFQSRLEIISDILKIDLLPEARPSRGVVSTIASESSNSKMFLPPAENFEQQFQAYVDELAARPGSFRSQNTSNNLKLPRGKLPTRPKVKVDDWYKIPSRPWPTSAVDCQTEAKNRDIYDGGELLPRLNLPVDDVKRWESIGRENVSILSYTDSFTCAAKELFVSLFSYMEGLEDDQEVDKTKLWNIGQKGLCMMYGAGWGLNDLVRNSVYLVGETMTIRRDSMLAKMEKKVPEPELEALRYATLNTSQLFDSKAISDARKAAIIARDGKYQEKVIKTMSEKPAAKPTQHQHAGQGQKGGQGQSKGGSGKKQGFKEKKAFQETTNTHQSHSSGKSTRGYQGKNFDPNYQKNKKSN